MDDLICKDCGWTMNPNPIDGYSLCERCEGETEPLTTEMTDEAKLQILTTND